MGTKDGQWYTVTCSKPATGGFIKLVTTRNEYLSISGIEVWTGVWTSTTTTTTTTTTSRSFSRPRAIPMGMSRFRPGMAGFGGHMRMRGGF